MNPLSTTDLPQVSALFAVGASPGRERLNTVSNSPATYNSLRHLSLSRFTLLKPDTGLMLVAGLALILIASVVVLRRPLRSALQQLLWRVVPPMDQKLTFLELAFPADQSRTAFATTQLFYLLSTPEPPRNWLQRLGRPVKRYSLEIVATQADGLRLIIGVPKAEVLTIYHGLTSYFPGVSVRETRDYLDDSRALARITQLGLSGDYLLPLRGQGEPSVHDPVAYIAGQMARLASNELIAYQIVIQPVAPDTHAQTTNRQSAIRARLTAGQPISPVLLRGIHSSVVLTTVLWLLERLTAAVLYVTDVMVRGRHRQVGAAHLPSESRELSKYEQQLADQVLTKIDAPLFEVSLRVLAARPDPVGAAARLSAVLAAFRLFASAHQSLIATNAAFIKTPAHLAASPFVRRLITRSSMPTILSAAELADLYHFPDTSNTTNKAVKATPAAESSQAAPTAPRSAEPTFHEKIGKSDSDD